MIATDKDIVIQRIICFLFLLLREDQTELKTVELTRNRAKNIYQLGISVLHKDIVLLFVSIDIPIFIKFEDIDNDIVCCAFANNIYKKLRKRIRDT